MIKQLHWIRALFMNRTVLWVLLITNSLGTIYGYYWYLGQMQETIDTGHPLWQLIFVPDSPTASLFFTLSIGYLLFRPVVTTSLGFAIRSLIEAYGAIASIKYGIWAVTMNIANASLGGSLELENWMLIFSHLGMAIEACLYTAYLSYGRLSTFIAAISLFVNDFVDYTYGVFPWLTKTLLLHLHSIQMFTVCLSGLSLLLTGILIQRRQHLQKQRTGLLSQSPS